MTTAEPGQSTKSELKGLLQRHEVRADKRLGQHFLLDLNVTSKIARLAGPLQGRAVIEVGPGPGGLTRALLDAGARVIAIEKDRRFGPMLAELAAAADGALTVVEGDALKADEAALLAEHAPGLPARIVSNLPYNVGAPLLVKWLRIASSFEAMTLMFQKEVAERIVAPAGGHAYGRLSVLCQAACEAEIVMSLPARAFTPPPKVDSAVVRLIPRVDGPNPELLAALERTTQAAFGQRRKMLRSSLKPLGGEALCRAAGIDPNLRAEQVPVDRFMALAALI